MTNIFILLPKVTQLLSSKAGIETQVSCALTIVFTYSVEFAYLTYFPFKKAKGQKGQSKELCPNTEALKLATGRVSF